MGDVAELLGAMTGTVLLGFLLSLLIERRIKSHWLSASERATRVALLATAIVAVFAGWGNARGFDIDLVAALRYLPGGFILWAIKRKQYQRQMDRADQADTFS